MNCPSCKKYYNDKEHVPLNLPCGHTFCKICLKSNFRKEQEVTCPTCNGLFNLRITDLSKNFIALNLGCELRETMKKYEICPKHDGEPLKFNCDNCQILFCPMCIIHHSGHFFSEQHYSCILKSRVNAKEGKAASNKAY
jgi:hypothetical protein